MLTPAFELSQDHDFLTVAIRVPHARAAEFDVYFEGVDFKFFAKPYFLRLTLPGRIVENGSEQGSYDADKGIFTIRLPKETPGQHFEGLNMLTALLAPRKSRSAKPLVEEIGASGVSEEGVEEEDEEFDWEIEQTPYKEISESALNSQYHYGFGNLRSGVVQRLQDELSEVIDIKDPDFTPAAERRQKRLAAELAKFDPDHYLADLFDDEAVGQILRYSPWWNGMHVEMMASLGQSQEQGDHATSEFPQVPSTQPSHWWPYHVAASARVPWLGSDSSWKESWHKVESAWTIRKLSPTLCWFETWTGIHEIVVSFGRRVLCYPLHRHFKLVVKACRDTVRILQLGKSAVLKCLLDIHKIFQENDPAYILNDLYVSDYCVWIQKAKSRKLTDLAEALKEVSLTKAQLDLELEELEAAALLVQEEETARKAAQCGSTQQMPGSSPEPSDSDGSDSDESDSDGTTSSGTEDSASELEEHAGTQPIPVTSLQGPFLEEGNALLIRNGGVCRNMASQLSHVSEGQPLASPLAPVIEEVGDQLMTTLQVSTPHSATAGSHSGLQDS
ncbi:protein SHQ1 homolog [Nannospalax galili]|uniref:protein SHQ1 homolog n=1 Tax=Nannospalax galili TaxID=1026970 RepID=UPI00111BCF48|nr:protein SHQ1 homolog [Nannospalax galili]